MPPSNTRQLDSICRLYFNENDQILGQEHIGITVNQAKLVGKSNTYHRSVDSVKTHYAYVHKSDIYSRVITRVLQVGNYDSVESNNGNYNVITYDGQSTDSNDITISLDIYVKQIGDVG